LSNSKLNEREPHVARWVWRSIGEEHGSISAVITQINPLNLAGYEIRLAVPRNFDLNREPCMGQKMRERVEVRTILIE